MFTRNIIKYKKKLLKPKNTAYKLTLKSFIILNNFKIKYVREEQIL